MTKEYHKIGELYGQTVLVELEAGDDYTKSVLYDYIKNGNLPKWIAADPKSQAVLFEKQNPLYAMPEVTTAISDGPNDDTPQSQNAYKGEFTK
jgi:hypothetical protein